MITVPERAMRGTEVAATFGISNDALRHYEREGLLPALPRTPGGYRLYPRAAVERVALIRGALAVGFTIRELKCILRRRDQGGAPCAEVLQLAREKANEVDARIAELLHLSKRLRRLIAQWQERMNGVNPEERARLLEVFITSSPENARHRTSPQVSPGLAKKFKRTEVKRNENGSRDISTVLPRRRG
jgi:DNA-binding transcriptional MerR regulator